MTGQTAARRGPGCSGMWKTATQREKLLPRICPPKPSKARSAPSTYARMRAILGRLSRCSRSPMSAPMVFRQRFPTRFSPPAGVCRPVARVAGGSRGRFARSTVCLWATAAWSAIALSRVERPRPWPSSPCSLWTAPIGQRPPATSGRRLIPARLRTRAAYRRPCRSTRSLRRRAVSCRGSAPDSGVRSERDPQPASNSQSWQEKLVERSGVGAGTEPCFACQGRIANLGSLTVATPEGDKQTYSVWRCRTCYGAYLNSWIDRWERLDNLETDERVYRVAPVKACTFLAVIDGVVGGDHPAGREHRDEQRRWFEAQIKVLDPLSHQIKHGR